MKIIELCKNYFSGFNEISKNNNLRENTVPILKIAAYFTIALPFTIIFGI